MAEIKVMVSPASLFPLYEKLSPLVDWLKHYKVHVKTWKGKKWTYGEHLLDVEAYRTLASAKQIIDSWASAFSQCELIDALKLSAMNELEPYLTLTRLTWDELDEWLPTQIKWDPYEW